MLLQKDYVNLFLTENFERIQAERKVNGFAWKPVLEQLLAKFPEMKADPKLILDPDNEAHRDRVRNNFLNLRKRSSSQDFLKDKPTFYTPSGAQSPPIAVPTTSLLTQLQAKRTKTKPAPVEIPVGPRRLIYDIETSPNIVFSWGIGGRCYLSVENIIQERAIICICWKWEDEPEVHSLQWNNGDDKAMLEQFAKVIDSADEIVTHNGDNFDTRWVRARCMFHGISISSKFNSIDTLKLARKQFRLNSNKLNYIAQFLGLGQKVDTGGYNLWKEICLANSPEAMELMITYCKGDVTLLERVYKALRGYAPTHKFRITKSSSLKQSL